MFAAFEQAHTPMRVCMVAYTFYETDNRVRRYAEALVKRGDAVDAIALRREGQAKVEVIRGVRVHRIQKRRIDESGPFSYLRKLLLFFIRSSWFLSLGKGRRPYDVIHVHSVPDFQVFSTLMQRLRGARIILDIHDIVPEFYASKFGVSEASPLFRLLVFAERISAAYSDMVIISNHLWREKLMARSVAPAKCTALINYPDVSIFYKRPKPAGDERVFRLCYPGTLNHHQGLDVAVRAIALLRNRAPQVKLLIVGDGPDRELLKRMAKEEHIDDKVTLQGFVPMETVAEMMAAVDLGIVPKRRCSFGNEAFSTKIMEFMAMGVPVLASNTRIDQYYFDERLVQFFESDDAQDLADKIVQLMEDPLKRAALRAEADKFIEKNNWDVKKHEYFEIVDRLIARTNPAHKTELSQKTAG